MKQINVVYQEFKEGLVNLINNSGVPMFMIRECLELVQARVSALADQELVQAKQKEAEDQSEQQQEEEVSREQA